MCTPHGGKGGRGKKKKKEEEGGEEGRGFFLKKKKKDLRQDEGRVLKGQARMPTTIHSTKIKMGATRLYILPR